MTKPKVKNVWVNGQRWYEIDGTKIKLPGVSAITGMMPKEGLKVGAVKATAAYAVRHRDELAEMPKQAAYDTLVTAYEREWSAKADLGTEVHKHIEDVVNAAMAGTKPSGHIRTEVLEYVKNDLRYRQEFDVKTIWRERAVFNLTVGYAGRLDEFCSLTLPDSGRVRAIVDTKSGASGVYAEAALQQTAYIHAEYYADEDTGELHPMPDDIHGAFALWLRPHGSALYPLDTGPEMFEQFKRLRGSYEWQLQQDLAKKRKQPTAVRPAINRDPIKRGWTPPNLG